MKRAASIEDLRELARRRLPAFVMAYLDEGAGDGGTVRRNMDAFDAWRLVPRVLRSGGPPDTRVAALGRTWAQPFGVSAVGTAGVYRRGADEMLAEAAREADVPFILSGVASASIEEIARRAPEHVWFQLYGARDPEITDDLVRRAADAGAGALVFTVDFPTGPRSEASIRSGASLVTGASPDALPRLVADTLAHPAWLAEFLRHGGLPRLAGWARYAPPRASAARIAQAFGARGFGAPTWRDLERVRRLWPGPLVVKGVIHPADALEAFGAGADAVTVSNHGGNKLDCMPASLVSLVAVRSAVGAGRRVFFDGGIRKGSDLIVARALGADFCFVGRPTIYGVAAGGAAGARRALELLAEELAYALTMSGCPRFADVSADFLTQDITR